MGEMCPVPQMYPVGRMGQENTTCASGNPCSCSSSLSSYTTVTADVREINPGLGAARARGSAGPLP